MSINELIQLLSDYQEYLYSCDADELEALYILERSVKRHRKNVEKRQ